MTLKQPLHIHLVWRGAWDRTWVLNKILAFERSKKRTNSPELWSSIEDFQACGPSTRMRSSWLQMLVLLIGLWWRGVVWPWPLPWRSICDWLRHLRRCYQVRELGCWIIDRGGSWALRSHRESYWTEHVGGINWIDPIKVKIQATWWETLSTLSVISGF